MSWHHLVAFMIAATMVVICAKLHMPSEQFNGVLQLGSAMVGGVAGVAVAQRLASRPEKPGNGNGEATK